MSNGNEQGRRWVHGNDVRANFRTKSKVSKECNDFVGCSSGENRAEDDEVHPGLSVGADFIVQREKLGIAYEFGELDVKQGIRLTFCAQVKANT